MIFPQEIFELFNIPFNVSYVPTSYKGKINSSIFNWEKKNERKWIKIIKQKSFKKNIMKSVGNHFKSFFLHAKDDQTLKSDYAILGKKLNYA